MSCHTHYTNAFWSNISIHWICINNLWKLCHLKPFSMSFWTTVCNATNNQLATCPNAPWDFDIRTHTHKHIWAHGIRWAVRVGVAKPKITAQNQTKRTKNRFAFIHSKKEQRIPLGKNSVTEKGMRSAENKNKVRNIAGRQTGRERTRERERERARAGDFRDAPKIHSNSKWYAEIISNNTIEVDERIFTIYTAQNECGLGVRKRPFIHMDATDVYNPYRETIFLVLKQ